MSRTVQLRAVCSAHSPSKLVHSSVSQATTAVTMDIPIVERAKSAAVVGFKHTQSTRNLRQTMTTQNVKPHQYTAGNLRHGNIKTPLREESDNDSANFSGKDSNEIEAIKLEKQAELQLATHEFKQLLMSKKLFKQLNLSTPTQQASQIVSGKLETEQQRKSAAGEDQAALTRIMRDQYNKRKQARMLKLMRSNVAVPKSYRHELVCEWLAANEKHQQLKRVFPAARPGEPSTPNLEDHVEREWNIVETDAVNGTTGANARERWDLFSDRMPHHVLLESYGDSVLQTRTCNFQTKERMIVLLQLVPQMSQASGVANFLISRFLTTRNTSDATTDQPKSVPVKLFGLVMYFRTNNTAILVVETDVQQNLKLLQRFQQPENENLIEQIKILQIYPDVQLAPGSGFVHGFDVSPGYSHRLANSHRHSAAAHEEKNWILVAARVAHSVTQLSTLLWPYSDDPSGRDHVLQEWQNLPNSLDFNPQCIRMLLSRCELRTPSERLTQHCEPMLFNALDRVSGRADDSGRPEKFYFYWQAYDGQTEL